MKRKIFFIILLVFSVSFLVGCEFLDYPSYGNTGSSNTDIAALQAEKARLELEIDRLETRIAEIKAENGIVSEFNSDAELYDIINEISLEVVKANVIVYAKTYRVSMWGGSSLVATGQGSGVIFSQSSNELYYYVLSNHHVVAPDPKYSSSSYSTNYTIKDYKANEYTAELLFSSADYDLAVLRFRKDFDHPLKSLQIETVNPDPGNVVVAIGQPEGQSNTITFGQVITYSKVTLSDTPISESNVKFDVISHDAPINSGSSGGVLLNSSLHIVGINYAGSHDDYGNFVRAYAIPIEKVIEYLTDNGFSLK